MSQRAHHNDPSIVDGDRLFRRIHLTQLVKDDDTGLARISTGAFRDRELSINIESILWNEGKTAENCLEGHTAHSLVSITAGAARRHNQVVCSDPLPFDLSHGLVCGPKNNRRIQEGLRDSADWVIPVEAPSYANVLQQKITQGIP
jgi:hypothetical protein